MKKKIAAMWEKMKARLDDATSPQKVKKFYVASVIVAAVIIIIGTVCTVYLNDYYRADGDAIYEAVSEYENVGCYSYEEGVKIYKSENATDKGFIFYPGGKVEYTAYEPLMFALAERGIVAVLVEMPFNLAVLDVNAADGIAEQVPDVKEWYIGGHSLGGSMAASYLADNKEEIEGLILLGSYSTADISDERVLSIYGSEDKVMNREKYEKYKPNLPADFSEEVIDGGNHAYFGYYGEQSGDGEATISRDAQIDYTVYCITLFLGLS